MSELKTITYQDRLSHRLLHDDPGYVSSGREIWIWDCTMEDWNATLSALRTSKFKLACFVDSNPIELPATAEEIFQMEPRPELRVLDEENRCFLYSRFDEEFDIDFDFDLSDFDFDYFQGSHKIIEVMMIISNATNKPCELTVADSGTLLFKTIPNSTEIQVENFLWI